MNLSFWKKDNSGSENQARSEQEVEYQYAQDIQDASNVPEELEKVSEVVSGVAESPEYYQSEPADPSKAKFYNNISRWALYLGVFLLPLFFLPGTSNSLESHKMILLIAMTGIALVSWLLGIVSSGYLTWRNNFLDKGVLALLLSFV